MSWWMNSAAAGLWGDMKDLTVAMRRLHFLNHLERKTLGSYLMAVDVGFLQIIASTLDFAN